MKRASKVALIVSGGLLMTGVGGIAAPALRDSLSTVSPPPKEDAIPPATPIATPDSHSPRFRVQELGVGLETSLFQAIYLNNKGEVLCLAEDRAPYQTPGRNGRPPITRYRTVRARYFIWREGHLDLVHEYKDLNTFRPIAFNDRSQILGFAYAPRAGNAPPAPTFAPFFTPSGPPPNRQARIVLWDNGTLRDLKVNEALEKAGVSPRFLPFLDTANVLLNAKGQLLIGLQYLYLWDHGTARRIGNGGMGIGERMFLNDKQTILRRGDQYRAANDGINFYPLMAMYQPTSRVPKMLDFGFGSFVFDLNSRNEMLVGRMFMPNPDIPRVRFSVSDGQSTRELFTVNGRTPGRLNNRGEAIAWRSVDGGGEWRTFFQPSTGRTSSNAPVFWDGKRLYDLASLVPSDWEIMNILDFNDEGQLLVQARHNSKLHMALLSPQPPG